jgi:hypothetical protein
MKLTLVNTMNIQERIKKLGKDDKFFYPPKTHFQVKLLEMGFPDTRITSIDKATRELHHAVCYLDKGNTKLFFNSFPSVLKLLQTYGKENEFDLKYMEYRE